MSDDEVICLSSPVSHVAKEDEVVCLTLDSSNSSKKGKKVNKTTTETPEEREERKRKIRIEKLEKHLEEMEGHITEWREKEVDLDDGKNSSYLVKTRMVNTYMKYYKMLCREDGAKLFTGRPIEKKIKIVEKITCPEIQAAVEKFLNGKEILFMPDYLDIEHIVKKVNDSSQPPLIPETVVSRIARKLFEEAVRIIKFRRVQDFQISVPVQTSDDPAENYPELAKKLKENERLRVSEKFELENFVRKQLEGNQNAVEINDENPDASDGESDDESEEEFLAAELGEDTDDEELPDIELGPDDYIDFRDEADEHEDDDEEVIKIVEKELRNELSTYFHTH